MGRGLSLDAPLGFIEDEWGAFVECSFGDFFEDGWGAFVECSLVVSLEMDGELSLNAPLSWQKSSTRELSLDAPLGFYGGFLRGSLGTLKILPGVAKKYYKKVLWRVHWGSIMSLSCGKKVLQKNSITSSLEVP